MKFLFTDLYNKIRDELENYKSATYKRSAAPITFIFLFLSLSVHRPTGVGGGYELINLSECIGSLKEKKKEGRSWCIENNNLILHRHVVFLQWKGGKAQSTSTELQVPIPSKATVCRIASLRLLRLNNISS